MKTLEVKIWWGEKPHKVAEKVREEIARLLWELGRDGIHPSEVELHVEINGGHEGTRLLWETVSKDLEGETVSGEIYHEGPPVYGWTAWVEEGKIKIEDGCLGGWGWETQPPSTVYSLDWGEWWKKSERERYLFERAIRNWIARFCIGSPLLFKDIKVQIWGTSYVVPVLINTRTSTQEQEHISGGGRK